MASLKLIKGEGQRVETVDVPECVDFDCPHCKGPCVMFPRSKPVAVQHGLPTCKGWQRVEKKKDDLERFLIRAGVHLLIPQGNA